MAFWSKHAPGHWVLTEDALIVAQAMRRSGRWVWEVKPATGANVTGSTETFNGAMEAASYARRALRAAAGGAA